MSKRKTNYPTFQLGQTVEWASQANGYTRIKRGRVVCVLPPGEVPVRAAFPSLFSKGTPVGMGRTHESYVVEVSWKDYGKASKHYWPLVSQLRLVTEETQAA